MTFVALDVALLPPPHVRDLAVRLSAALPRESFQGLRLDEEHLPHITLTQQFVPENELERVLSGIDGVLAGTSTLQLRAAGAGKSRSTVWITIERSPALHALHARLMAAIQPFERGNGGPAAFIDGDARPGDVQWVSEYRR